MSSWGDRATIKELEAKIKQLEWVILQLSEMIEAQKRILP